MVTFTRATPAWLAPRWREVRVFWRLDDKRRRHKVHVEDVRRSLILNQSQLWVAWDDAPTGKHQLKRWQGPHCLGLVVTCLVRPGILVIQFAAGLDLQHWLSIAIPRLEMFARACGAEKLELFCRKGWRQELRPVWQSYSPEAITFHHDPDRLCLYPVPLTKGA